MYAQLRDTVFLCRYVQSGAALKLTCFSQRRAKPLSLSVFATICIKATCCEAVGTLIESTEKRKTWTTLLYTSTPGETESLHPVSRSKRQSGGDDLISRTPRNTSRRRVVLCVRSKAFLAIYLRPM